MRYLGFEPTEEKPYYFISYNSEDEDAVVPIVAELNHLSIPMWYDYAIPYDENWSAIIAEKVDKCEAVILFYSNKILEKNKSYVIKEYHYARRYTKRVYVVLLEDIAEKIPYDKVDWIDELEKYQLINGSAETPEYICNELLRYIKPRNKPITEKVQGTENNITTEDEPIKCADMAIQDCELDKADMYYDETLNENSKYVETYIDKLSARNKKSSFSHWSESKIVPGKSLNRIIIVFVVILLFATGVIITTIINNNHKTVTTPVGRVDNVEVSEVPVTSNDDKDSYTQDSNLADNEENEQDDIAITIDSTYCNEGGLITFGSYEQDNDISDGKEDIEWRILAKEDNRILVISDKALDCKPYNTSFANVTWETCTLREWLNGTFLNDAFTEEEQGLIQSTNVSADNNLLYDTNPGNATTDKVFLLSITEAEKYLASDEERQCVPTGYANAQGAWISDHTKKATGEACCWWWLRSTGNSSSNAAGVRGDGTVSYSGDRVYGDYYCVRPAMWISLNDEDGTSLTTGDAVTNAEENEKDDIAITIDFTYCNVGDLITFGSYEQDNDISDGKEDIEWRVLAKEDNRILVISDKAIDSQPYNTSFANVTWETCTLREWLNGTFLNDAFTKEEQRLIQSTNVSADKNPEYGTDPGNATVDKIFLLSITEAEKYFSSDEDRKCVPTKYTLSQDIWTLDSETKDGEPTCMWWLRSPGRDSNFAATVLLAGCTANIGEFVGPFNDGIRPAMWINQESQISRGLIH